MTIRMIAMDLDGTLLNKDKDIVPKDLEAVKRAIAAGYYVTLATGRMFRSALPYAKELGITHPLVVYNGALIRDPATGEDLGHWPVPLDVAQPLLDDCLARGIYIQAYINDTLWTLKDCEQVRYYSGFARVPYEVKGEEIHHLPSAPHKLLIMTEETDSLAAELTEKYAGRIRIVSSSREFLEITAPATNKWRAVQTLAAAVGIRDEEIMCMGDSGNDVDMVARAGIGVAMGNASDAVIKAAKVVTATNENNGVAMMLDAIMTKQVDVPE